MSILRHPARSPRAELAARSVRAVACGALLTIPAGAQDTTPGMAKFPEAIFEPYRIEYGFDDDLLRSMFNYSIGGRGVGVSRCERASPSAEWQCLTKMESAAFIVTDLTSRQGGEVAYLAGIQDDGTCVLARWEWQPRRHGWTVAVPLPAGTTLGTPLPPTGAVRSVSQGGEWESVPESATLGPPDRSVVHTSVDGPFYGLDADPEGRYLVYYDMGEETLFQLDLTQTPPVATAIADSGTQGSLDQVGSLELGAFEGEAGRKLLIRRELPAGFRQSAEIYTLFSDAENDGQFESVQTFDQAQWEASPYSDPTKWDRFLD